jgi:hypothetical protein
MVGPTYGDIWRFMVPALVSALEEVHWKYKVTRNTVPVIEFAGQPVYIISAEHPDRFAGFEVGHIWVDEGARIQTSKEDPLRDAPLQIRSRLRHPKAKRLQLMVSTTPEGMDTWVQRDWFDKPLPNHRAYIGKTRDNTALRPEYLQAQLASLPAELVEQYLDGVAVSYTANRAHPTFRKAVHVESKQFDWLPGLPAHLGADYNVSPMCWIIGQQVGDCFHVLDEVVIPDFGQVDGAMHAAHAKGWSTETTPDGSKRNRVIVLHPDKSAKSRSTVGDPEFVVMTREAKALGWSYQGNANGVNPPITNRINLVSRMLLDATGRTRLFVHPRCVRLIEDLERTGRLANGGYDPGPEGKRGHILDGLGYTLWDLFPQNGGVNYAPNSVLSFA